DAVVGAAAMIRDITDEKAATKDFITDTERRYRTLIKTLPVAAYVCDLEGRLTLYNDAAVRLWGREPRDADKWGGGLRVYTPDGAPVLPVVCPMGESVKLVRVVGEDVILLEQPEGTMLDVLSCPCPLFGPVGKREGAGNVLIDVTTGKRSPHILE